MKAPLQRNTALALTALLASSGTLVCCVLPALMVALGAGATLAGLVTAVPQLIWLSEHKVEVFTVAAVALAIAGISIWRARQLPCPADPLAAAACMRLRRYSAVLFTLALFAFSVGATFAFILPVLSSQSQ
jgi:uncharacterized membrane protein YdcZ (DUF606 family)